ncbi:conserved domain-containing protein [Clostridium cavendishii DSM 21758]|uniref:Conserved domain-containing protein n=1 Tax=Clostridium cavendishii DSM 21758 TaxID=1121302 RepID=A0A1M6NJ41_9CLOT|nr:YsnF/AvaK domain-containing protein [Clostridium cavendishii]SHJ95755.1 conserved domain-containing protein [Clostridium cavendishii DSM 21758]
MANNSFITNTPNNDTKNTSDNKLLNKDIIIKLKKEELNITKEWIKTGDVKIHKERFIEEKHFIIPITHEELVIEKKSFNSSDSNNVSSEIVHIPLTTEKVEFTKEKFFLEDVSIYKEQIKDIKQIETILKEEKIKIKTPDSFEI